MDQSKKSLTDQLMNSQFLKRVITKLLLSVSVFSLFFSHQTFFFSLLHNLNFYFSTLPMKLASHTLDKNCTFLLCNGLLVFLVKFPGGFSSSSSSSKYVNNSTAPLNENSYRSFGDDSRPEKIVMEEALEEVPLLEKEYERESTCTTTHDDHKHTEEVIIEPETTDHHQKFMVEEEENQAFVEEEELNEEQQNGLFCEEIEEEEDRGGNGMLSTEELIKKFDDFIKKMKEELRIEAQRHLVMV